MESIRVRALVKIQFKNGEEKEYLCPATKTEDSLCIDTRELPTIHKGSRVTIDFGSFYKS